MRAVEFGMHAQLRADWLARLDELVGEDSPAWIAVEAEQVRELSRQGKADQVHARAAAALPRADEISRARLLMAESIVDLLHQQPEAEEPARDMLQEATALLRVNGEREWEADAWLSLGFGADLRAGRIGLAVEHIERALALCSPAPRCAAGCSRSWPRCSATPAARTTRRRRCARSPTWPRPATTSR